MKHLLHISLALVSLLLLSTLIGTDIINTGRAAYTLLPGEATCTFEGRDIPLEQCCYELPKMLSCEKKDSLRHCGQGSIMLSLNEKAFQFCKAEGYHVPK
ncbi:MAG: hypothetical protein ABIH34_03140 [Nanoarchaeota archaeon]